MQSGGVVPLGKICHDFLGVKRAQLEGHFMMNRVGDQWQVQHFEGTMAPVASAAPPSSGVQLGSGLQADTGAWQQTDVDLSFLDAETGEGVAKLLEEAGGVLPLGHVTQKFPGLKRLQLIGHFELDRVGENGQWEVRLPGIMPSGAEIMFEGRAVPKGEPLPPLNASIVESITFALELQPEFTLPMMKILEIAPGVKRQQLEPHFEIMRIDKKKFNVRLAGSSFQPPAPQSSRAASSFHPQTFQPQAFRPQAFQRQAFQPQAFQSQEPTEEVAPLDSVAVQQVEEILLAAGGSANLGKVSSILKFIKRSQLEGHFELERIGDQWEVRIPAGGIGTAEKPPPRLFPLANNRDFASNSSQGQSASHSHRIGLHGGRAGLGPRFVPGAVHRGGLNGGLGGGPVGSANTQQLQVRPVLPRHSSFNVRPVLPQMQSATGSFSYAAAVRGKGAIRGVVVGPMAGNLMPPPIIKGAVKAVQRVQAASDMQPITPLDPQTLDKIESLVLESGGSADMGNISGHFAGVKRAHLEERFNFSREGDQWVVSLSSPAKRQRVAL